MSAWQIMRFEVRFAEEEEDPGAEGRESWQSAGGVFEVLNNGVDAFGRRVSSVARAVSNQSWRDLGVKACEG